MLCCLTIPCPVLAWWHQWIVASCMALLNWMRSSELKYRCSIVVTTWRHIPPHLNCWFYIRTWSKLEEVCSQCDITAGSKAELITMLSWNLSSVLSLTRCTAFDKLFLNSLEHCSTRFFSENHNMKGFAGDTESAVLNLDITRSL